MCRTLALLLLGAVGALSGPALSAQRTDRSQPKVLYLSGKVALDDGTAPTDSTRVELVCNLRVIRHAFTRTDGSFYFELGLLLRSTQISASTAGPDALETESRGLGGVKADGGLRESGDGRYDLTNCEIRLKPKPGISANRLTLGIQSEFQPDVGVIIVRQRAAVQGTTVSLTTLGAPKPAKKAFQKGRKELSKPKASYEKAARSLEKAVGIYTPFAEAWHLLGESRLYLNDPSGAGQAFQKAISIDPSFIPPYLKLAGMELEKFRWKEAAEFTSKLIELDPYHAQSQYFHALANYSLGQYQVASEALLAVEQSGGASEYPAIYLMLGDILARQGKIPQSAQKLRAFLAFSQHTPEREEQLQRQLRQWEEQGLIQPQPPKKR